MSVAPEVWVFLPDDRFELAYLVGVFDRGPEIAGRVVNRSIGTLLLRMLLAINARAHLDLRIRPHTSS